MLRNILIVFVFYSYCPQIIIGEQARYDFYRVYTLTPQTMHQVKLLTEIENTSDSYQFIMEPRKISEEIIVIVPPHKFAEFSEFLDTNEFEYSILDNNLQESFDAVQPVRTRTSGEFDWNNYYSLENINNWLKELSEKYPEYVTLIKVGKTYQNRDIIGVKLSYKSDNKNILIEGGMHAREWISPSTATYILHQLLTSNNTDVRHMAESYNWYILPVINADGYVYSMTTDRLWRKTLKPNGFCKGTDPNRNFDISWSSEGSNWYPCAQTYRGTKAFSEIETRSYADFLLVNLFKKLTLYVSLHSYSQKCLFPYGYTSKHAVNHDDMLKIGKASINALRKRYGTIYTVGNVYDEIYPASGASMDWVYDKIHTPLVFTYELRPKRTSYYNKSGFELPPSEIIPTVDETFDAIKEMVHESEKLGYL